MLNPIETQWFTRLAEKMRSGSAPNFPAFSSSQKCAQIFLLELRDYAQAVAQVMNPFLLRAKPVMKLHVLELNAPRLGFILLRHNDKLVFEFTHDLLQIKALTYSQRREGSTHILTLEPILRHCAIPLWQNSQGQRFTAQTLLHDTIGQFVELGYAAFVPLEGASQQSARSVDTTSANVEEDSAYPT